MKIHPAEMKQPVDSPMEPKEPEDEFQSFDYDVDPENGVEDAGGCGKKVMMKRDQKLNLSIQVVVLWASLWMSRSVSTATSPRTQGRVR